MMAIPPPKMKDIDSLKKENEHIAEILQDTIAEVVEDTAKLFQVRMRKAYNAMDIVDEEFTDGIRTALLRAVLTAITGNLSINIIQQLMKDEDDPDVIEGFERLHARAMKDTMAIMVRAHKSVFESADDGGDSVMTE